MKEQLEKILNDLPPSIRHSGELEELKEYSRSLTERVEELERESIELKQDLKDVSDRLEWVSDV